MQDLAVVALAFLITVFLPPKYAAAVWTVIVLWAIGTALGFLALRLFVWWMR